MTVVLGANAVNPIPTQSWVFRARTLKVVDGDTIDLELDVGLHGRRIERLRLLGVNTPETHGATREAGLEAAAFTGGWLSPSLATGGEWPLVVQTYRSDAFGRFLAIVWRVSDGRCLNDDLLATGQAVPFRG